ncbi:MAG: hypothetical protein A2Y93_16055 [Chloroflexi bacterium RBG_13_68_17]|nr:MAG: hypothetical protein A2Y93_16055 [Chloroflexi bacterium RBG_13_68_17]
MLMAMGLVSLLQIGCLPGLLILRAFKVPRRGAIQAVVYCFAVSLVANCCMVMILVALGAYTRTIVMAVFLVECLAALWFYRGFLSVSLRAVAEAVGLAIERQTDLLRAAGEEFRRHSPAMALGVLVLVVAAVYLSVDSLLWLAKVFRYNLGDIFRLGDAVVNWNVWATMWARQEIPPSYQYPQLIPTNWSLTYVLMGNTQVQFFATAIMPLFALFTLLLLWDLAVSCRQPGFLLGLIATRFMMKKLAGELIDDGYVDIAIMFFYFLPVHGLIRLQREQEIKEQRRYLLISGLFAGGAALTKQSGLLILALWPVLAYYFRASTADSVGLKSRLKEILRPFLLSCLIAAPWYVWSFVAVERGLNVSAIEGFATLTLYQEALPVRVLSALKMVGKYNLLFLVSAIAIPIADRGMRSLTLLVVYPYLLIWALLLSYDTRNLTPVIPIVSMTAGLGFMNLFHRIGPLAEGLKLSELRAWIAPALVVAGIVAGGVLIEDQTLVDRQVELQRGLWYPQLNEMIYARVEEVPGTRFLTNYRMDFLPGLLDLTILDHLTDPGRFRELLGAYPDIRTVLVSNTKTNEEILEDLRQWVEAGSLVVLVEMGNWTMFGVPEGMRLPANGAEAND